MLAYTAGALAALEAMRSPTLRVAMMATATLAACASCAAACSTVHEHKHSPSHANALGEHGVRALERRLAHHHPDAILTTGQTKKFGFNGYFELFENC